MQSNKKIAFDYISNLFVTLYSMLSLINLTLGLLNTFQVLIFFPTEFDIASNCYLTSVESIIKGKWNIQS